MKILILSINYWPEVTGIGAFTTYRAEHLAAAGHEVEVCTTFPYYPEWKVTPEYKGKWLSTETRNGVRILRSSIYVPKVVTSVKRIVHEASFVTVALIRTVGLRPPDVMLVVSPPLGLAVPAILLSKLWRVPYVFDVEDLQPDSAADHGMLPSWAVKLLYAVERRAYRYARLVTTLTASMRNRIIDKGVPAEKVKLLEPRMDETLTGIAPEEGKEFRRRYDLGDKFLVTHSGNMGVKQGLDVVIDSAHLAQSDPSVLFLIVGDGADRARIQSRAAELDLQNVRFLPLLDEKDFRGLLKASDICLVTQQPGVSEIAFPSKIVTYLGAGRPIIAAVNPDSEVASITRDSGSGNVIKAGDAESLWTAIREMRGSNLLELGKKGQLHASSRWSAERVLGHLERNLCAAAEASVRSLAEEGTSQ